MKSTLLAIYSSTGYFESISMVQEVFFQYIDSDFSSGKFSWLHLWILFQSIIFILFGRGFSMVYTLDFYFSSMGAQLCPALSDPMDCSPPGSSVHGTLQARILDWVAFSSSRVYSRPRDQTCVSCTVEPPLSIVFSSIYLWFIPNFLLFHFAFFSILFSAVSILPWVLKCILISIIVFLLFSVQIISFHFSSALFLWAFPFFCVWFPTKVKHLKFSSAT